MINPEPSKPVKSIETARIPASGRSGAVAAPQAVTVPKQLNVFEHAMRLFHGRKFKEAREAFRQARDGPERHIAHRADLHIRMCDQRLQETPVSFDSAEDHYNYAVALINTRNLAAAQEHLRNALALAPESDHVHYALALSGALSGDLKGAAEHLRLAIELEPRNRIAARQDADFAPYIHQPPLDALVFPEKRGWPGH